MRSAGYLRLPSAVLSVPYRKERRVRDLTPPPIPSDERIEAAAEILARLSEVEALAGWWAKFTRDDLNCLGVYPPKDDEMLGEITAIVPQFQVDWVDPEGSFERNLARCRLAVRHGIEDYDLELGFMRKAIEANS
jgi:hypothetical protein